MVEMLYFFMLLFLFGLPFFSFFLLENKIMKRIEKYDLLFHFFLFAFLFSFSCFFFLI